MGGLMDGLINARVRGRDGLIDGWTKEKKNKSVDG